MGYPIEFVKFIATGRWKDPVLAWKYVIKYVLVSNYRYLSGKFNDNKSSTRLVRGAVAGYNCGAGNVRRAWANGVHEDAYTAGKDYSQDVFNRKAFWDKWYEEQIGEQV